MPTCGRAMCRRHCKENGGCLGKLHGVEGNLSGAVPACLAGRPLPPPPPSQRRVDPPRSAAILASQNSNTRLSTPASSIAQPVPASTSLSDDDDVNPTRDPRFISHMPDVFNKQYATQQRLQESKRAADEERLSNKKKADETVMGYAFIEVRMLFTLSWSCGLTTSPRSRTTRNLSLLCSRTI